jgi:DNA repair protein RecO (recombination protein O)
VERFSTKAIVLRARNTGTADVLATLLAPRHGRIVCAARNARKSFKRFSGCLNLFSEIDAVVAAAEGRDVMRIESASLVEPFEGLRRSHGVLATGSAGVELVERILRGTEEAPAVYSETREFLSNLSATGCGRAERTGGRRAHGFLLTCFSLRVLALSGFRPELDHCVSCGRDATKKAVRRMFDLHRGGLLCPRCAGPGPIPGRGFVPLSPGARSALKEMLAAGLRPTAYSLQPALSADCARLVEALIVERLGSPLRSWTAS